MKLKTIHKYYSFLWYAAYGSQKYDNATSEYGKAAEKRSSNMLSAMLQHWKTADMSAFMGNIRRDIAVDRADIVLMKGNIFNSY